MRWSSTSRRVALGATLLAAALAGCATPPRSAPPAEGIGYREARFEEMAAMRAWRDCRDEAFELDRSATGSGSAHRYLASARLLERCEANLGAAARIVAREERMRAYAVAVQNHLRGGDVAAARRALASLEDAFPDADLYLADGSSVVDSLSVVLEVDDRPIARANVGETLREELVRLGRWRAR